MDNSDGTRLIVIPHFVYVLGSFFICACLGFGPDARNEYKAWATWARQKRIRLSTTYRRSSTPYSIGKMSSTGQRKSLAYELDGMK